MTAMFPRLIAISIAAFAVVMSAYHLYTGYFGAPEALLHRSIHLFFVLILIFSLFPISTKEWAKKFRWVDVPLILIVFDSIGYLFVNYDYVITRYPLVHPLSSVDMILGILLILLLMEGSRRVIGPALPSSCPCGAPRTACASPATTSASAPIPSLQRWSTR